MDPEKKKKSVVVEDIIRDKNPRLMKLLPRFVVRYIKRMIHENEVNEFIDLHGHKYDLEFVHAVLTEFNVKIIVVGEENIPATGGCIFAMNHPLGGFDALAIIQALSGKRTDIKFIVNDILLQLKNMKGLFVGVNKHGKNSTSMLEDIDKVYASGKAVLIFPAGLVSRKQGRIIRDLEWKKSFITKAKQHERNIIPVHIEAKNSNWFYGLARWRKRLGIKANIEMFYLVDEMYRQRNRTITVIFGKAIPYQAFDKRYTDKEWAEKMKEHVYALPSGKRIISFESETKK